MTCLQKIVDQQTGTVHVGDGMPYLQKASLSYLLLHFNLKQPNAARHVAAHYPLVVSKSIMKLYSLELLQLRTWWLKLICSQI